MFNSIQRGFGFLGQAMDLGVAIFLAVYGLSLAVAIVARVLVAGLPLP
jgi:hypothetical protein